MTARLASLALLAPLPLLLVGCADLEGQQDAGRGMQAIMKMLGTGNPAALAAEPDDGRPTSFRADARRVELDHLNADPLLGVGLDGSLRIDIDVPCPDGGKMKLDGTTSLVGDLDQLEDWSAYGSLAVEFDMDVKFRRCKIDGIKLGGELHYALDMDVDTAAGTASLQWSYTGDVRFKGDVEGRCEIDMVASASTGDAFTSFEVRAFAGTMCGLDAEEVSLHAELEVEG